MDTLHPTHEFVRATVARWLKARADWQAAGSHIEDWEHVVGPWADAYDEAVRRLLHAHSQHEEAA